MLVLAHIDINPVILQLGPLALRWYGMMYVVGFVLLYMIINKEVKRINLDYTEDDIYNLIFYGVFGVILGGRLGYVLFYQLDYYINNPTKIIMVNEGGMSFHGGLIGVILATIFFCYKNKKKFWEVADLISLGGPLGLGFGRIGNFINGELYGRTVDDNFPLAMTFEADPLKLPRHPSQLYESIFEGFLTFIILQLIRRSNIKLKDGSYLWLFLMLYGIFRFFIEYTRKPDAHLTDLVTNTGLSMGQYLCLPMIIIGVSMFVFINFIKKDKSTKIET